MRHGYRLKQTMVRSVDMTWLGEKTAVILSKAGLFLKYQLALFS
jgi:hypothetical protein